MLRMPIAKQKGFSLIELMIGLVIGLVVSAAMIAFMAATLKSNSETIQSMKLSNELRALTEVISRDLRRARGMQDPLANIGTNCVTTPADDPKACEGLAFSVIDIPTASSGKCILYGYDSPGGNNFRAVRLVESGGVGTVLFDRSTTSRSCSTGGSQISSDLIDIEKLEFKYCQYTEKDSGITRTLTDCINIVVVGKLRADPDQIQQTFSTSVGIRSGQMN